MLEDELGFLKALVHRLEPFTELNNITITGVYDSKSILHHNDYGGRKHPSLSNQEFHKDLSNPIKEVFKLSLADIKADELCLHCFSETSDLAETLNEEELRDAIFIICKLENIAKGHDYAKILRENRDISKIYSLALEYFSYIDDTDNYLTELWMNIPERYFDSINDYFIKNPIKTDLVHKLTLGSHEMREIIREHCKKTFNSSFDNEKLVLISLMPHYEAESKFYSEMSAKLGGLGRMFGESESQSPEFIEKKEMHELSVVLLSSFAHKSSLMDEVVKVPFWVIEALRLSKPEALLSKPYEIDDEPLIEIALKLYQGDKRKGNLYSDFDAAMSAAKVLNN